MEALGVISSSAARIFYQARISLPGQDGGDGTTGTGSGNPGAGQDATAASAPGAASGQAATQAQFNDSDSQQVKQLKEIDQKVHQHEAAHIAAAAGLAISGPQYEYKRGPDGQMYAVGGEVSIDTSAVPNNPEATADKARRVAQAALAPADPSAKDRQVASHANAMENQARMEMMSKRINAAAPAPDGSTESDQPANKLTVPISGPIASYQGQAPNFNSFLNLFA
jgi:hypothetical protein